MMWIEKSNVIDDRETWRVYEDGAIIAILEIGQVYESNSGALYKLTEVHCSISRVKVTRIDRQHNESYYWFIQSLICNSMKRCEEPQQTIREFPLHT